MKVVDFESWPRRSHFEWFSACEQPHVNITSEVDATLFYQWKKRSGQSFTLAMSFFMSQALNSLAPFRMRSVQGQIVEYDAVHPSITFQAGGGQMFNYYLLPWQPLLSDFMTEAQRQISELSQREHLSATGRRDVFYLTSIPWIHFTSVQHPIGNAMTDDIPRIAYGRLSERDGRMMMPVSIQAHHGFVDGSHIGELFSVLQKQLNNCASS